MSVRLRLRRIGKINRPAYRICAIEKRKRRDGEYLESIGFYDPYIPRGQKRVRLDKERAEYWLSVGAQPSLTVLTFLRQEQVSGLIRSRPKRKNRKKPASVRKRRAAKAAAGETTKKKAKGKPKAAKES
jgi:small subunit ribosomal protein S16